MKISKIRNVKTPSRGTDKSAGLDFYVPNDFEKIDLKPQTSIRILSGIKCKVPEDYALIAFNKSGIALKGLDVGACVIDEDYQGEISLHVFNYTNNVVTIEPGQKLVQFLLIPVYYADIQIVDDNKLFSKTSERSDGGFGSTGLK